MKITCSTCGEVIDIAVNSTFESCKCGNKLLPQDFSALVDLENRAIELQAEINKHSDEHSSCGKFIISF